MAIHACHKLLSIRLPVVVNLAFVIFHRVRLAPGVALVYLSHHACSGAWRGSELGASFAGHRTAAADGRKENRLWRAVREHQAA